MTFFGLVIGNEASKGGIGWARYFDFTSFGFMTDQLSRTLHTNSVSIGASTFDPKKAPIVFPGLTLTRAWVLPRLVSTFAPLLLLPLAALCFHRFDPVRTRQTSERSSRNWIGRLQNLFKPLSRRLVAPLLRPAGGGSFLGAMWSDAVLTLMLYPLALVAFIVITIVSMFAPLPTLMPGVFAALAIIVADVATRDVRANTVAALRSMPRLRENFVWWKLGSTLLLSLLLAAVPLRARGNARILSADRSAGRIGLRRRDRHFVRRDDAQPQDLHRRVPELLVFGGERSRGQFLARFRRVLRERAPRHLARLCRCERVGSGARRGLASDAIALSLTTRGSFPNQSWRVCVLPGLTEDGTDQGHPGRVEADNRASAPTPRPCGRIEILPVRRGPIPIAGPTSA